MNTMKKKVLLYGMLFSLLNIKNLDNTPVVYAKELDTVEEMDNNQEKFEVVPSIMATTNVNIRKYPIHGEIMGILAKNTTLTKIQRLENNWYKVEYQDTVGYVCGDYVQEINLYEMNEDLKNIGVLNEEATLTLPKEIDRNESSVVLPKLEYVEIYEETTEQYLVKTEQYIGYIPKTCVDILTDTFVVVDISDQNLTLYQDNQVLLSTPVVTGSPRTPSDQGLFEIYKIRHNCNLVGPGYVSYVDIMMNYNRGEGLHDAEYHTHEDGYQHGWRSIDQFGGSTYLTNGSHGCINMPHDAVFEVANYVDIGTKVLVKK